MKQFEELLSERTEKINEELLRFLPKEEGLQRVILEACNYSVENGGKRIRPVLMETAYFLCKLAKLQQEAGGAKADEACGVRTDGNGSAGTDREPQALYRRFQEDYESLLAPFLAAIEMIHSSSLVHDDLPCMDNDRLRRGKPSTWAKYGEDMGTLAGDGLMIYAFETACKAMYHAAAGGQGTAGTAGRAETAEKYAAGAQLRAAGQDTEDRARRVVRAIEILAQKTGIFGMIGGQTVDVALTGKTPDAEQLDFIYRLKTGALLEASAMIGAVLAGAEEETVEKLRQSALELGMAFQIRDDILDETATSEELGKTAGSDERNQKTTYVTRVGLKQAEQDVTDYTERAVRRIREIADYPFFPALCSYLIGRKN